MNVESTAWHHYEREREAANREQASRVTDDRKKENDEQMARIMADKENVTDQWDPIDSLIYLSLSNPLDVVMEMIVESFGDETENEDVKAILGLIEAAQDQIKQERNRHRDGRTCYSTGVPFDRVYLAPQLEPDSEGSDRLVVGELHVSPRPDGWPREPFTAGGVWLDEVAERVGLIPESAPQGKGPVFHATDSDQLYQLYRRNLGANAPHDEGEVA